MNPYGFLFTCGTPRPHCLDVLRSTGQFTTSRRVPLRNTGVELWSYSSLTDHEGRDTLMRGRTTFLLCLHTFWHTSKSFHVILIIRDRLDLDVALAFLILFFYIYCFLFVKVVAIPCSPILNVDYPLTRCKLVLHANECDRSE